MSQGTVDLRIGEKEITVHVARSERVDGWVAVYFTQVTSPNSRLIETIHLSKEEAQKLRAELGEILERGT